MTEDMEDPAAVSMNKSARVAITTASVAVRAIAKQRQEHAERIAAAERDEAARLQSRWNAERAAAQAQGAAANDAWLDRVGPQEVAGVWQTAAVWSQFEPEMFADNEARLAAEIQRRYGVDVRGATAEGLDVAADLHSLADAERVRESEHEEAAREAAARAKAVDRDDELGAALVMSGAGDEAVAERAAEMGEATVRGHAADGLEVTADGVEYDSDARRAALAGRAAAGGAQPDAVHARVVAANANGKPGRQATSAKSRVSAKSRTPQPAATRDIGIER